METSTQGGRLLGGMMESVFLFGVEEVRLIERSGAAPKSYCDVDGL